jgi:cytochrome c-type biogenesis protein CcmH
MCTDECRLTTHSRRLLIELLVMSWLSLALASLALAQQPSADDVNRVARQLSCPTCTGINVADCPTETCAQWRAKIGELLAAGKTDQEILDYFAARYGDHVLQVPPVRGFFVGVWVVPIVAVVAGLAALAYLARGWSRRAPPAAATPAAEDPVEDNYIERVERDLKAWDK